MIIILSNEAPFLSFISFDSFAFQKLFFYYFYSSIEMKLRLKNNLLFICIF